MAQAVACLGDASVDTVGMYVGGVDGVGVDDVSVTAWTCISAG